MSDLLGTVTAALTADPVVGIAASAALGAASVLVSPCHLAGIPLVVGVVQMRRRADRSAAGTALRFGVGVLLSFLVVGVATVAVGRIAGDLGAFGNLLGAALFLLFGLQLLDVIDLPWFSSLTARAGHRAGQPVLIGLLFGASLGPCTFSFMAPALGVAAAVARESPLQAAAVVSAFAVAHTAVVVLAGVFGGATESFLRSRGATTAVTLVRRLTGVVLILGALYFLYTVR